MGETEHVQSLSPGFIPLFSCVLCQDLQGALWQPWAQLYCCEGSPKLNEVHWSWPA